MPDPTENSRRRFSRIAFDSDSTLLAGGQEYPAHLLDLSLNGAMVGAPRAAKSLDVGSPVMLAIQLIGSETEIRMECHVAHRENDQLGLACDHVDLDSAAHLRRLVELNLGDSTLLDRELAGLIVE